MDQLTEDFEKSLFSDTKDVLGDYIEIGIDSFINDGILKDIPIVNTIVAVLKAGKNTNRKRLSDTEKRWYTECIPPLFNLF